MSATPSLLTRKECSVLRGIAIIGIFLHNYCHWLGPIVKENEYTYSQHNVDWLTRVILHPDANLPIHILSFFGHYGVPVFFFLSAFGLVMKYENDNTPATEPSCSYVRSLWNFVVHHYLKLFTMMIVGYVAFTMLDVITPGSHHYAVLDIIAQLFMFNNVLPDPDRIIWPGPYWFFGVMLQLYIVYRLLLYRKDWKYTVGLILICWLLQVFCSPESETLNRIRYNFIGGMLPFGAGLLYARYGKLLSRATYASVMILSAFLIFVLSFNYQTWFWAPLLVCSFCVSLVKLLPVEVCRVSAVLSWMGSLSAALFVCHPITRKIFIPISRQGDVYAGLLLYVIASVALAWMFRELIRKINNSTQMPQKKIGG